MFGNDLFGLKMLASGFCFDADDVSGGSAADTSSDISQPEAPDPAATQGFSQDDVNKLMGKTRKEARQAAINELLSQLGVENVDSAKAALEAERKRKEAEMSVAEKLQKQIDDLQAQLKAKADREAELQTAMQQERLNNAIRAALSEARDKEDAFILFTAKADTSAALNEDGSINEVELKKQIEKFKADKPDHFKPSTPGSPSNAGGRAPKPDTNVKLKPVGY